MREDVFTHIQTLSHAQFNNIPNGTLVTRVTSDINVLFNMYTNVLINLLKNVVTIIGVFVTMFLLNATLTLILLMVVPVIFIFTLIFRKYLRKVHRTVRTNVSSMNAFLSENISGIKITQVFNQEEKKYEQFKENNKRLEKSLIKQIFVFGVFRPLIYVTKNDIITYLDNNKIKYYIDESNNMDVYTRNRYRKYMLPFLKSEDGNVHKKYIE